MKLGTFNPDPNLPNDRYISQLNAARIRAGIEGDASKTNVARKFMEQIVSALFQNDKYEGIKREITDAVRLYADKSNYSWNPRLVGRNMVKADFKKQDCKSVADMHREAGKLRSSLSDYQEKACRFGEQLNGCQKQFRHLNEKLEFLKKQGLSDQDYQKISKNIAEHQGKIDAFEKSVLGLGDQWRAGEEALKPGMQINSKA
ncbi:MAG: hypothetical protein K2L24_02770, partial [Opitutales bacterium]|nr:hypothetical protein [Opitutales bacterium]